MKKAAGLSGWIRLDFEIIFRTLQILFLKESTEGIGAGQETALREDRL